VKGFLLVCLVLLAGGCGSSNTTCNWMCDGAHGSKTYPSGSDAEAQCTTDFDTGCASFQCTCSN